MFLMIHQSCVSFLTLFIKIEGYLLQRISNMNVTLMTW